MRTPTGLVIDPPAAREVRCIFDLLRSGQSIRKVAETVGMRPTVVERIAKREAYKQRQPGRIVDARVWNAAQAAMASRRRSPGRQ